MNLSQINKRINNDTTISMAPLRQTEAKIFNSPAHNIKIGKINQENMRKEMEEKKD